MLSTHEGIRRLLSVAADIGPVLSQYCVVVSDRLAQLLLDERRVELSMRTLTYLHQYTLKEHTSSARKDLASRARTLRRLVRQMEVVK